MNIKKVVESIKEDINSNQVKDRIASDLNLKFKNNRCLCFLHNEKNPSMSFDTKNKKFKCFSCGKSYDIFNHYQEYHSLSFLQGVKEIIKDFSLNIYLEENKTIRKANKKPTEFNEEIKLDTTNYISKRKISKSTLDKVRNVKSDTKGNIVFQYKNETGELVANKFRPAKKVEKGEGPKMWFEKDTNINSLYNMENVNITEELVICEGEFDALSLIECGISNVVSVPTGCNSSEWIKTNYDFLEQFEQIKIWFDNDEAGKKGAREASNRLPNKVKIVVQDEGNDINEILFFKGKKKVLEALENAEIYLVEGVSTLDMIEDFDVYEAEKIKTGIKDIDDKILGILFGSLNVFAGKNGAGKSTLLNQIYVGESIRQGYNVFVFSGELEAKHIKKWIIKTLANENDFIDATSSDGYTYKKINNVKSISNRIGDKLLLYDDDNYHIDAILEKMQILAKRYGTKVFIIDNLMVVQDDEKDDYKSQTNIVKKLKSFAKKYDAIVHLVAHPRKSVGASDDIEANAVDTSIKDEVAGSANITNLADYVTIIERNFKEDRKFDARLSIVKNRHTGVNASVVLKFDRDRSRFYSSGEKLELGIDYLNKDQQFIMVEQEFPF